MPGNRTVPRSVGPSAEASARLEDSARVLPPAPARQLNKQYYSLDLAEIELPPGEQTLVYHFRFPANCSIIAACVCISMAPAMQPTKRIEAMAMLTPSVEQMTMPVVLGVNAWPLKERLKAAQYEVLEMYLSHNLDNTIRLAGLDFLLTTES